jgi:hypothetical protein
MRKMMKQHASNATNYVKRSVCAVSMALKIPLLELLKRLYKDLSMSSQCICLREHLLHYNNSSNNQLK